MSGFAAVAAAAARRVRCCSIYGDTLFESQDPAVLAELTAALATESGVGAYCMCAGTLELLLDNTTITLHHGETLRWQGSHGNVPLVAPEALMAWLTKHGMPFVRAEWDAANAQQAADRDAALQWQAAMPRSLAPFFDEMRSSFGSIHPAWTAALEAEFPDPVTRARELLRLFGTGAWPGGQRAWESVTEELLLALPTPTLLEAFADASTVRGTLRLVASGAFRKRRKALSPELCERLLTAAAELPDAQREHVVRAIVRG